MYALNSLDNSPKFPLRSFNEWGRLKEVIVGQPFPNNYSFVDYSFCHFNFDNINEHLDLVAQNRIDGLPGISLIQYKEEYLSELSEDIESLIKALETKGVNVLRPKQIPESKNNFSTPYWESSCWPALNVRDRFLVLGQCIIETTPCIRSRYFETDLLKPLLYNFFENGATWVCMPRPIMTDYSFDKAFIEDHINKTASRELLSSCKESYYDIGVEIMMDAANCLRLGKDIIVNVADKNQLLAFNWLKQTFGDVFDFHMMESVTDNHIDSYIIVIRPGLLLIRNKMVLEKLPAFMKKWDYIIAPEGKDSVFPQYSSDSMVVTSKYIDTNILSLDENTVIANSLNQPLLDLLDSKGIEVIPVRHRHRRLFGGGFHCFTLDTNRDSDLCSYR